MYGYDSFGVGALSYCNRTSWLANGRFGVSDFLPTEKRW